MTPYNIMLVLLFWIGVKIAMPPAEAIVKMVARIIAKYYAAYVAFWEDDE